MSANSRHWDDFIHFDGNAQSFRLLARLQNWRERGGCQLSCAVLSASFKYPFGSQSIAGGKSKFGYFVDDARNAKTIFEQCGIQEISKGIYSRHPLSLIVEAADDIAYLTTDIVDGFRSTMIDYEEAKEVLLAVAKKGNQLNRFHDIDSNNQQDQIAYLASSAATAMMKETIGRFETNYDQIMAGTFNGHLLRGFDFRVFCDNIYTVCKTRLYCNENKLLTEASGYHVVHSLMDKFGSVLLSLLKNKGDSSKLNRFEKSIFDIIPQDNANQLGIDSYKTMLFLTDLISGITDTYALSLFQKLTASSVNNNRML